MIARWRCAPVAPREERFPAQSRRPSRDPPAVSSDTARADRGIRERAGRDLVSPFARDALKLCGAQLSECAATRRDDDYYTTAGHPDSVAQGEHWLNVWDGGQQIEVCFRIGLDGDDTQAG